MLRNTPPTLPSPGLGRVSYGLTKTNSSCGSPNQPFYSTGTYQPHPPLMRFDDELLSSIHGLGVPMLRNTVRRPSNDEVHCGGFGYVERASWKNCDVAIKFLKDAQTVSSEARSKRVGGCLLVYYQLDSRFLSHFAGSSWRGGISLIPIYCHS